LNASTGAPIRIAAALIRDESGRVLPVRKRGAALTRDHALPLVRS
jgi:hypothetical protein